MTKHARLVARASLILALTLAACAGNESQQQLDKRVERVEELAALREETQARLSGMTPGELAEELTKDSERGLEPFNSMAYTEMVSRGAAAAADLRSQLVAPNRSSFLGLLALREMDASQYRELTAPYRVAVLVDALKESTYFNAWGLPHLYWEDAAEALIAEGSVAEPPLRELLSDVRPAPMWGEEEVIEYEKYQYRVSDYAWALLLQIRGIDEAIPESASERDELIAEFVRSK